MKKYTFIAVAFAALATVSCVKDNMGGAEGVVYDATFSDAVNVKATITVGAEQSLVSWETTDRVGIMYGDSNVEYKADQAGARTMLSPVSASADASEVWAVLPYDASATLVGGVISTTLPAEQPALEGGAFHHLAVAHSTNGTLAFRNVCGLVRVRVTTEGITKVVFAGKASEKVAGDVAITVAAEPAVSTGTSETVALVPASGQTAIAVGDYFLAVLPQNFASGFTVTAYKGETAVVTKVVAGPVELKRCGVFAGTIREVTISAISTNIATVGETVKITGTGFSEVAADNTVSIGNIACTVTAASATELSVTVPAGLSKLTDYRFTVKVSGANAVETPLFRYYYLPSYSVVTWLGTSGTQGLVAGKGTAARLDNPYAVVVNGDYLYITCSQANANTAICRAKLSDATMEILVNSDVIPKKNPYAAAFYGNEIHTTLKAAGSVFRYNITTGESGTYTASSNPMDICILSSGVRYVAARDGKCIDVYQKDSDTKTSISLGFKPISLSVDSDEEYLYLGAYEARKLYRMKLSDNTVTQIAGTGTAPDKPVNNASSYPTWNPGKPLEVTVGDVSGVYCDSDDYVYFNDNHSTRVQVLIPGVGNDPTKGLIRTFNATASPGTFGTQGSITKDSNGNFYVASRNKHKIVKMIPKN